MAGTTPDGTEPPGGPAGPGGGYRPFNMANIMKAQERLLSGGGASPDDHALAGRGATGPVPDAPAADQGQLGLSDWLDILVRRWMYVAMPLVLVPTLTLVYSLFSSTHHQSTARLILNNRNFFGRGGDDGLMDGNVYVSSDGMAQMAKLESVRKLAAEAMNRWAEGDDGGLLGSLWLSPCPGAGARHSRDEMSPEDAEVLGSFDRAFAVVSHGTTVIDDTRDVVVEILATHESRLVAAAAADALATGIVKRFNERRYGQWQPALIREHLARNRLDLEKVNRDIAGLRREAAGDDRTFGGFPLELERQYDVLKEHQSNLRSLKYMIEEAAKKVDLFEEQASRAERAPPEGLVHKLIDLELEREQIATRYTDAHPKMRKIAEDIERTQKLIDEYPRRRKMLNAVPRRSYYDPNVQLAIAKAKHAGLLLREEQLKERIDAVQKEIRTNAQERSLKYELCLTQRKVLQEVATRLQMRLQRAELVIRKPDSSDRADDRRLLRTPLLIEVEPAATRPVGARRWQSMTFAVAVGLIAGIILAFLAERLDETVRLPAEMRAVTGTPTLQVVPELKRSLVIRPEETISGIANVFAVLRNNIRYSAPDSPERSVLVTSSTEGEGKSLIAVNLAVSFAQEGSRVCMVDADVQKGERHAMEEAVKLAWEPRGGLTTYLEGEAEMEKVLVPCVELANLSFVGSGGRAANPPRALKSERAAAFFGGLQQEFDVVVVDAPPVLPVVDAALLARHCRSVIHVVRYGYTRRSELEEAARRLRHVGAPVIGLVLNCARRDASGYYYRRYRDSAYSI